MAGIRYQRTAGPFWLRFQELDLQRHHRRRTFVEIAEEAGVEPQKVTRWIAKRMVPPADALARLIRVVGMSSDEALDLLADSLGSSGDTATLE